MSPAFCEEATSTAASGPFHYQGISEGTAWPYYKRVFFVDQFLRAIYSVADRDYPLEEGESRPPKTSLDCLASLILEAEVPNSILSGVEVSTFYGELDLAWEKGGKQITLLCGGVAGDMPRLHYFRRIPNEPSEHGLVSNLSSQKFKEWVEWLNAK